MAESNTYPCGHGKRMGLPYGIDVLMYSVKVKVVKVDQNSRKIVIEFSYDAHVGGSIALYLFNAELAAGKGIIESRIEMIEPIKNFVIEKGENKKWRQEEEDVNCPHHYCNEDVCYLTIVTHSGNENPGMSVSQFTQAVIQMKYNEYQVKAINQYSWCNGDKYQQTDLAGYSKSLLREIPYYNCLHCLKNKIDSTTQEVGMLLVSTTKIAQSTHGNASIHDGAYGNIKVTVKKMSKKLYEDVADKEIKILEDSASHPNFPLYYNLKEEKEGYVYIALERCACSLKDLIKPPMDSTQDVVKDMNLLFLGSDHSQHFSNVIIRGVAEGLDHLHNTLGYVHGGLNQETILIRMHTSNSIRAVLSDLGGCQPLFADDDSSSTKVQVQNAAELKAKDLFDFGELIIFPCITRGKKFKDRTRMAHVPYNPKASDLISSLTNSNSEDRPTAKQVIRHPLLWIPPACIKFLTEASNQMEKNISSHQNPYQERRRLRYQLDKNCCYYTCSKNCCKESACCYHDWKSKLHSSLYPEIDDQEKRRRNNYDYNSASDLVRLIRNLYAHPPSQGNLPAEVNPHPYGFAGYIVSLFPELGWEVYKLLKQELGCKVYTLLEESPLKAETS